MSSIRVITVIAECYFIITSLDEFYLDVHTYIQRSPRLQLGQVHASNKSSLQALIPIRYITKKKM